MPSADIIEDRTKTTLNAVKTVNNERIRLVAKVAETIQWMSCMMGAKRLVAETVAKRDP
jgi:metal-sulfur cluster biosynthetic enzyme